MAELQLPIRSAKDILIGYQIALTESKQLSAAASLEALVALVFAQ